MHNNVQKAMQYYDQIHTPHIQSMCSSPLNYFIILLFIFIDILIINRSSFQKIMKNGIES